MQGTKKYEGLVFVKHGRIGTRSEGPDYYLQTKNHEYGLIHERELLFKPDYYLEFFCRKMVAAEGTLEGNNIRISHIEEICKSLLPDEQE
ncbi:MAG: hypothetical protein NTV25_04905 [Methanothrix sp.]|nr:hypothetical protein [Methanothrix sp.]